MDELPPPSDAEARTLAAVGAPPNARLACLMRPTAPISVFRVFAPDGKRSRAHASQGKEAQLAVLFLDMRVAYRWSFPTLASLTLVSGLKYTGTDMQCIQLPAANTATVPVQQRSREEAECRISATPTIGLKLDGP